MEMASNSSVLRLLMNFRGTVSDPRFDFYFSLLLFFEETL
jgi:hypothetical protein